MDPKLRASEIGPTGLVHWEIDRQAGELATVEDCCAHRGGRVLRRVWQMNPCEALTVESLRANAPLMTSMVRSEVEEVDRATLTLTFGVA